MPMEKLKRETEFAKDYMKLRAGNFKSTEALRIVQEKGFQGTLRSIQRHVKAVRKTGYALCPVKKDCSHGILDEEKMKTVYDWILRQNDRHAPINYAHVKKYIFDEFHITCCRRTAGNILHRLNTTMKICRTKNGGFRKSKTELKQLYMEFIGHLKKTNAIHVKPEQLRSIDVTYTGPPNCKQHTFSPKGGGTEASNLSKKNYTNAIVTMISSDGIDHTPCMMFTYDPRFAKQLNPTIRRNGLRAQYEAALKEYNIKEDRIVYKKSTDHWYSECPDVYEHFLNHYDVPKDVHILHDGGNAFKRVKTSIFENLGYKQHVTYPADVHQYLSPNDNKLHGCKSTWFEEYWHLHSGVEASLRLMNLIDLETIKNSKKYFQQNLLNVKKSTLPQVMGF